jgi:hypothetical protein
MTRLLARPLGANTADHYAAPTGRDFLRWEDPEEVKLWILSVRSAVEDGLGAGDDAARRLRHRVLSRAEVRRKLIAAGRAFEALIGAAENGLARVTIAPRSALAPAEHGHEVAL